MTNKNNKDFVVGTVREIRGTTVVVRMFENYNQLFYFFNENRYSGVVIGSFIGIRRNEYIIVGKIEKEYAFDTLKDPSVQHFSKERFIREIEIKVLGNIYNGEYSMGMAAFPQLFNDVILLSDNDKKLIIERKSTSPSSREAQTSIVPISLQPMIIGNLWPEGIIFNLKWYELFNSHIAIFGNTGSGKSNTLARIYHELFTYKHHGKKLNFSNSKFLLIDFNGEYIGDKCIVEDKKTFSLNTRKQKDRFKISKTSFWSKDMLSVLFGATEQTQQPFLARIMEYYFQEGKDFNENLPMYVAQAFGNVYSVPNEYSLDLFKRVLKIIELKNDEVSCWINKTILNSGTGNYYVTEKFTGWGLDSTNLGASGNHYWNKDEEILLSEKKMWKKM